MSTKAPAAQTAKVEAMNSPNSTHDSGNTFSLFPVSSVIAEKTTRTIISGVQNRAVTNELQIIESRGCSLVSKQEGCDVNG